MTNYRGLPAVSYHDMYDFDLQQEVCAKAGITGRIISNPFAAEVMAAVSKKPALDVVKHVNDQNAEIVARSPDNCGLGTLNPLDASHVAEGERCLECAPLQGPADLVELARPVHRRRGRLCVLGMGAGPGRCRSSSIRRACRSGTSQQMDQYKLDELVGRPFDTAMALARMILSGLFDRYPRLEDRGRPYGRRAACR